MKAVPALLRVVSLVLLCAGAVCAQEVKPITVLPDPSPVMYGRSMKIKATVEAVDLEAREITVKGPAGRAVTLRVEERVRNLPEVKVGDEVTVRYHQAVGLALRKAAEGETAIVEGTEGTDSKQRSVVATVEAVSPKEKTVTVKGPDGNFVELYVRDAQVLASVATGDTVVTTYTEPAVVLIDLPREKKEQEEKKKKKKRK